MGSRFLRILISSCDRYFVRYIKIKYNKIEIGIIKYIGRSRSSNINNDIIAEENAGLGINLRSFIVYPHLANKEKENKKRKILSRK